MKDTKTNNLMTRTETKPADRKEEPKPVDVADVNARIAFFARHWEAMLGGIA